MKLLILLLLLAVVASLMSGLFFLGQDRRRTSGSPRLLKALKIRVALSALLILVLISSYFMGWISPQGYIQ